MEIPSYFIEVEGGSAKTQTKEKVFNQLSIISKIRRPSSPKFVDSMYKKQKRETLIGSEAVKKLSMIQVTETENKIGVICLQYPSRNGHIKFVMCIMVSRDCVPYYKYIKGHV